MANDFKDTNCIITGAASGIGRACAVTLAERGAARLILVDRDKDALDALDLTCETVRHAADVSDPDFWASLDTGPLHHAVLNAGIAHGRPIEKLDFADWRRVMAVNLDGMFLSLKTALAAMDRGGSAVLTASATGVKAEPGIAAYAASKAATIQLARVAAKEVAPRGIRVNAIAPGGVDTAIWDTAPFFKQLVEDHGGDRQAALDAMASAGTPLGQFATPELIAAQIAFLLSADAASITGTALVTDGGYTL
ncbi:SDR family NAD(P)-dependent oxidoreductase [Paraurantiacibacter namhicola]|uniref:2-(S)-hydroxypropyl-CoM dehydrogenase n=1 Tax=Paraurantiacibacter namhicola TaxID=645517 RepID=A0A1C7D869_9SPHN|nr:SDR family oxidoreductase [Paraurantiacibacter namhicola]ANU07511.1 2-(S)-hydroxypropyl-CoM dehydrogenase [Paraurantiacibacter namhicola]